MMIEVRMESSREEWAKLVQAPLGTEIAIVDWPVEGAEVRAKIVNLVDPERPSVSLRSLLNDLTAAWPDPPAY